jgi:hypothetical protein
MTSTRPPCARRATRLGRRSALLGALAVAFAASRRVWAFGEEGAFNPRLLVTGTAKLAGLRARAPGRWSAEVVRRTSAPARLTPTSVRADDAALLDEPFAIWAGSAAPEALTRSELEGLRRFFALSGVLLCDELDPDKKLFLPAVKRELRRVLPDGSPISIGPEHVLFRSFYLLRRATGRVAASAKLEAIVRGGAAQVVFSPNDLLGALARAPGGVQPLEVVPGGEIQREQAIRLAVNIAMYVLCSDYKDDQVHAPSLMRRRAMEQS